MRFVIPLLIAMAAALGGGANAQTFPSRPVRIVVPFPPGGTADVTSRILAEHMAKGLGQPVLVENRPGGSTIVAAEGVARSPADGHTLLVVFPSFVINPALRQAMSFDPLKDFAAVGQTTAVPVIIAVNSSVPAKSLQELIAVARSNPGQISYGTPGAGTIHHVMGEMLKIAAKINIVHVPFQGGAPALTAAIGGHIQVFLGNATDIGPAVKSGKMRVLAVTSGERSEILPDVPTMREVGYPELEGTNWSGMVVARATPASSITRLNAELVRSLRSPEIREKLRSYGMSAASSTPEQFGVFLNLEAARYSKVVREAGVRAE